MSGESEKNTKRTLGSLSKAWDRRARRNRSRRRAVQAAGPRKPGDNRLVASLHELWRLLWGPHESSPK